MNILKMKTLETERLILRQFTLEDVEAMYLNWGTDKESCRTLDWSLHENKEVTKAVIENWIQKYETELYYNWVVELKETGEIIGAIETVKFSKKDEYCEIGYCYGSKWWNYGYATEALKAVIQFLLCEVEFRIVEARHISENPASGKVMAKAGMKQDGVLRSRRINKDTKHVNDLIVYSIVKDEIIV